MGVETDNATDRFLFNAISCPACNAACAVNGHSAGACSRCGLTWKADGPILDWAHDLVEEYFGEKSSKWLADRKGIGVKKIIFGLKEMSWRLIKLAAFPLRWFSNLRVNHYYFRTLTDKELARTWAAHYFCGMKMPVTATILDYGCGRGRIVGLLSQLNHIVAGQDIRAHSWWKKINSARFQVVPPQQKRLPWKDATFDVVLNFGVICHLTDEQLRIYAGEVARVLRPGGYWVLQENNHRQYNSAFVKEWYGRVHSKEFIETAALAAGLRETHFSYEGFWSPVLPHVVNYARKIIFARRFDVSDYNSWLAKMIPDNRQRWCLFHFQKDDR